MVLSNLVACEKSLGKLLQYQYLPARQVFFLSTMLRQILETLDSFHNARTALLKKYGTSDDDVNYVVTGEDNVAAYNNELDELETQEVDLSFPADKIMLCVESIEKAEIDLPPDKRLGFTAADWINIQRIIKVTESEE